jgi:hypothetical protein
MDGANPVGGRMVGGQSTGSKGGHLPWIALISLAFPGSASSLLRKLVL